LRGSSCIAERIVSIGEGNVVFLTQGRKAVLLGTLGVEKTRHLQCAEVLVDFNVDAVSL
jgi:hypothetical protein